MKMDLKAVGISDGNWYVDRGKWRAAWSHNLSEHQQAQDAKKRQERRRMWCVMSEEGVSVGKVTRLATSVLLRE